MKIRESLNRITEILEESRNPRPVFNTREASRYLGLSTTTLERMRSDYSIPFVRLGGRVAYRRKDLDQFINDRVVSSVEDERRVP